MNYRQASIQKTTKKMKKQYRKPTTNWLKVKAKEISVCKSSILHRKDKKMKLQNHFKNQLKLYNKLFNQTQDKSQLISKQILVSRLIFLMYKKIANLLTEINLQKKYVIFIQINIHIFFTSQIYVYLYIFSLGFKFCQHIFY